MVTMRMDGDDLKKKKKQQTMQQYERLKIKHKQIRPKKLLARRVVMVNELSRFIVEFRTKSSPNQL